MHRIFLWALLFVAAEVSAITDIEIADESETAGWLAYGRTHSEQRFSPLQDINLQSIKNLKPDWYIDLPEDVALVSTPLVVDGVLYFIGTMNVVRAVDATSGRLIWEYDPEVRKAIAGRKQAGMSHSRGITAYGDKLFLATWDGRLIALDRKSGKRVWSTRTFDLGEALYITGAPKAFKGLVLIGNGGTETGPHRGYVTAYHADTGKQAWRFHIVPGNPADGFENKAMAMAAKTWTGEWWKHGGGGHAWHGFTYDSEFDTIYIGTGNGAPWNRKNRSPDGGDNLFLCSIVALDAKTGEYKWHYQTTPGETWDYNSNMDIVLADLEIEGEARKVILHAPKNGFFYVLDRVDGKLISAEPFASVNWATHIDLQTGRPVEVPGARYEDGRQNITPSLLGAHSWHAMSYSPKSGLVYLPTLHTSMDMDDTAYDATWSTEPFVGGTAVDWKEGEAPRAYDGSLQAWDPIAQTARWEIPQPLGWSAGALVTAGDVVFQGQSDGFFKAYDAETGAVVWSYDAGLGISAPPITYKLGGKQYIALLVGYGGAYAAGLLPDANALGWAYGAQRRRLIAFSLEGEAEVPAQAPPYFPQPLLEAGFEIDPVLAEKGEILYLSKTCYGCHGVDVKGAGMAPDLRASAMLLSEMEPVFARIVREGERAGRAMPAFPDISDDELEALRHYIRKVAHTAHKPAEPGRQ